MNSWTGASDSYTATLANRQNMAREEHELPDDSFKGVDAFRETGVRTRIVSISDPS